MKALGFPSEVAALEEITVDPRKRYLILRTKNITASSLFQVVETCIYSKVDEYNTDYEQHMIIYAYLPIFSGAVEDITYDTSAENSNKGVSRMFEMCENFEIDGIQGSRRKMGIALDVLECKYDIVKESVKDHCELYMKKLVISLKSDMHGLCSKADD